MTTPDALSLSTDRSRSANPPKDDYTTTAQSEVFQKLSTRRVMRHSSEASRARDTTTTTLPAKLTKALTTQRTLRTTQQQQDTVSPTRLTLYTTGNSLNPPNSPEAVRLSAGKGTSRWPFEFSFDISLDTCCLMFLVVYICAKVNICSAFIMIKNECVM